MPFGFISISRRYPGEKEEGHLVEADIESAKKEVNRIRSLKLFVGNIFLNI